VRDFYRDAVANGAKDTCVFDYRAKSGSDGRDPTASGILAH